MSFNMVTAIWIAKIFIIYSGMVVLLPYIVMHKFLAGRSLTQKFIFCVVGSNFFCIMLVLMFGVFHITNRYVLIAGTCVFPGIMLFRNRKQIWEKYIRTLGIDLLRFIRRENSFHYCLRKLWRWLIKTARRQIGPVFLVVRRNVLEWTLFIGCSAFIMWYFSITNHFGPRASDLVVHMNWINEVDKGNLFCNGIYPFGMHALIYYMHAVFGIPTVRIVLVFGTVQTFYIFTMLLVFIKECCKFRYTPYLAYIAFAVGDYIQNARYSRYYSTLPQEFGMIFLLPCAVALIRFFRAVREENKEYKQMKEQKLLYTRIDLKKRWKESTIQLWVLIISFGLTLSAHFYITIIAALLLVSVAIVNVWYVFQWKIFRRLVLAAVLAILIPVFPMAIAFAGGTPLEGSLYWALGIMGIERETETEEIITENHEDAASDNGENAEQYQEEIQETASSETIQAHSIREKMIYLFQTAKQTASNFLHNLILKTESDYQIWVICILILILEIPFFVLIREWEQIRFNLLFIVYTGFMTLLAISGYLGLPAVIDENRVSIFYSYTALVCISLSADGIMVIMNRIMKFKRFFQMISFAVIVAFTGYTISEGRVREKIVNSSSLERDGAALCVYDIMENFPEYKWTIISCNEERNMISSVGWHYEVIDFLSAMENYSPSCEMYIPTQYVFFFVEKEVLNYAQGTEFTDTENVVSEEWANYMLPVKNGLSQYSGQKRIIVNSRMYYWAQEYRKRFPNEMKVYYEDDEFICYFIEQNEYYLNNFAIDYGYNSGGSEEWSADQTTLQSQ